MAETIKNVLSGNGVLDRKSRITFIDVGYERIDPALGIIYAADHTAEWYPVGEDNDELSRERNDSVDATPNVLGKTNISVTPGAQTTGIDPYKLRGNDKFSYLLYMMDKYDLRQEKAKVIGMEVTYADVQTEGVYGAWTEHAILSLNSTGGDTSALSYPGVLNWCGDKTHGTFSTTTKQFTATTAA